MSERIVREADACKTPPAIGSRGESLAEGDSEYGVA